LGNLHLIPGQIDGALQFLDPNEARQRRIKSWQAHDGKIQDVLLIADGHAGDSSIRVLSVGRDGKLVLSDPSRTLPLQFQPRVQVTRPDQGAVLDPGGQRLVRAPGASGTGQSDAAPTTLWSTTENEFVVSFAVSHDGARFAVCVESEQPRRHRLEIHTLADPAGIREWEWNFAHDLAFSPDGRTLAAVRNNDIVLIDCVGDAALSLLCGHRDTIRDLEFSPDGATLASVSHDQRLIVWDTRSRQRLWSRHAHANRATCVAFHPHKPTLVTVGVDAMLRFWRSEREPMSDEARLVGQLPMVAGGCDGAWFSESGNTLTLSHADAGHSRLVAQHPSGR
jgi:WD40 repeat protein